MYYTPFWSLALSKRSSWFIVVKCIACAQTCLRIAIMSRNCYVYVAPCTLVKLNAFVQCVFAVTELCNSVRESDDNSL
jgi:phosphatidylglycerophosphate synthase